MSGFTELLGKAQRGDRAAWDIIYAAAFRRLRSTAARLLGRERSGHTLQPTALVTESFLKLHRMRAPIASSAHFFHLSARAMKQVLVEHGRARRTRVEISPEVVAELLPAAEQDHLDPEVALSLRSAFEELRDCDPVAAEALWLRCVEGWTIDETSRLQRRESWRVREDCDFSLEWLASRLNRRS